MPVKRHMHKALGFAALAALAGFASGAHAAQLDVTASVPNACSVAGGTLAFGEYVPDPINGANAKIATGDFSVTCTVAASVNVLLDGGLHHGQGSNGRAMLGEQSGQYLDYKLYQGAAGASAEWGDDSATVPAASKNFSLGATTTPISVQGLIATDQLVGGGNYSDTVEITLVFNQ